MIAVGVGDGARRRGTAPEPAFDLGPVATTGATEHADYYQTTDYRRPRRSAPRDLALGNCKGSISVVKQVVPSTAPAGSTTGATPAGGWLFTGSSPRRAITIDPPTGRTTATGTGAVNFPLTFAGGTTTGTVTFAETPAEPATPCSR